MPIIAPVQTPVTPGGGGTTPTTPPPDLPPEITDGWAGLSVTWTSAGGQIWDLTSPDSGVVLANQGVRGLNMPPITRYSTTTPALAGSRYTGFRIAEREVFWPLFIFSSIGSIDFVSRDSGFWNTMRPDQPGLWTITREGGTPRFLSCRYADDGDQSYETDPVLSGWILYGITLVADTQPMWQGLTLTNTFLQGSSPGGWFAGTGTGAVFLIGPSSTLGGAIVQNPGDVDAWPVWTVHGPCDAGSSLGVGGGTVVLNQAVPAGRAVVIDTRPDAMTAITSLGVDVSGLVSWAALPCPPGERVVADIALTGPGSGAYVAMDITPLYYRAW